MTEPCRSIPLDKSARIKFTRLIQGIRRWSGDHQTLAGVTEMAAGAAILAIGIKSGAVVLGVDAVLSTGATVGSLLGASAGAWAGFMLGGVGLAALGTAIAIPAAAVAILGSAVFGLAGYAIGDFVHKLVHGIGVRELLGPGALLVLGVGLLLDGARRILHDTPCQAAMSELRDDVLHLSRLASQAVLTTRKEFEAWRDDLKGRPMAAGATSAAIVGSALATKALAASSVTVLGSSSLGSLALSLGLVSTPLWPVFAAAGLAAAVCYASWRAVSSSARGGPRTGASK